MLATDVKPAVKGFFHEPTNTVTYIVSDPETKKAAIIDPVLDFNQASARTDTTSADHLISYLQSGALHPVWILETHIHADHLSGAHYLKERLGAPIAAGNQIPTVQKVFGPLFSAGSYVTADGRQFDHLFTDGETLQIGNLTGTVLATPGHTPACISYHIGDAVFVGDTLFMPDYGTARCDFPGGDAGTLYDSIERILALPDETRMFLCHDYPPEDREPAWETTVSAQRAQNVHISGKSRSEFVELRQGRDEGLAMPQLIVPSIQVNIQAGELPPAAENGIQYLQMPLNQL